MRWSTLWWFAVVAAVVMLEDKWARAAPSPRNEDMFRELLKLDQMYSAIARPSVRSEPTQPDMGPKVQRAINMLRLQHLDRLYADRARPRFGKRVETNSNFAPIEYEGQMMATAKKVLNKIECNGCDSKNAKHTRAEVSQCIS